MNLRTRLAIAGGSIAAGAMLLVSVVLYPAVEANLRGQIDSDAAEAEFDRSMAEALALHNPGSPAAGEAAQETSLVVLQTPRPVADLLPARRPRAAADD